MPSYNINYTFAIFFGFLSQLLPVNALGIDYSRCAIDANQTYWRDPNNIFLRDQLGNPTNNMSQAWGISYESCKNICTNPVNTNSYDWNSLSQGLTSWLLPWLALTAQLPFETKDKQTNLMALLLALGSPSLITFSLAMTILDARWINRIFRHIKENTKSLRPPRPLLFKAIKAARTFLIESQHVPIQIFNGPRREFAQLVARPQNWAWWHALRGEIQKTKREWTYSLYAQIGWVCVTQLIAVIDFFTTASFNTSIGIGLAINSLWVWMIPVVLGWVYVGTQTSAGSIKAAIASTVVPALGLETNVAGECIGIRDRTTFDESYAPLRSSTDNCHGCGEDFNQGRKTSLSQYLPLGIATRAVSTQTTHQVEDTELGENSGDVELTAITLVDLEQQVQSLLEHQHRCSRAPHTFLGFSIAGCDLEPGPVFNYARVWSHMNAVQHVAEAFSAVTGRQRNEQSVHGQPWNHEINDWDEIFRGSPEELSKYVSLYGQDKPDLTVHGASSSGLVLNCIAAALVTIFLQWGSTGAAIVIAYKTPVVGLGCQSGSYLIYGIVSTLVWILLVFSASISNRWSLQMETAKVRPHFVLGPLAVTTRLVGKSLAAANTLFLVATSAIQFTGLYDNCWCDACIPSLGRQAGWVILFASDAQISAASKGAWIGGVAMSLLSAFSITVYILTSRGDEVFKQNIQ